MEQHPDRLVAFLDELHCKIASSFDGGAGADGFIQALVNEATERNLTTAEQLVVPAEFDPDHGGLPVYDDSGEVFGWDTDSPAAETAKYAYNLHTWAYTLTGASANSRKAVSQIGGADVLQRRHPGFVDELVARVANELAREAS